MMTRHLQRLTVVVAVLLASANAVTVVPVTPTGPPRTIDPRYPDYIVFPRVSCVEEGYFHHPRNCSWFYRCEDKMNRGFFRTTFYECAPGTVFEDALDVCVFPSMASPPCGGKPIVVPTPPTKPPTKKPTPTPTPTPPTIPETPGPPGPNLPCIFDDGSCRTYEICRPNRETKTLCSNGCRMNGLLILVKDLCGAEDLLFDQTAGQCVSVPTDDVLCSAPPSPTPTPTQGATVTESHILRCSDQDTRPAEDWIKSRYCSVYVLCDADKTFLGSQELCTNFYQCIKRSDGSWTSEVRHCLGDFLFSFEEDRCLAIPSEEEQC